MKSLRRIGYTLGVLAVLFGLAASFTIVRPVHHAKAQLGATAVPGFYAFGASAFPPTVTAGQAGTVTNTSGLVIQIDGGPVFCNGNQSNISESLITLAANKTFLVVYNCPSDSLYAKTGVTGPGTPSPDQPGVPSTILTPVFGIEVPLATVVCGASTCATITDARPLGQFTSGVQQAGSVLFANLPATMPNGAIIYCSNCLAASSPCTGASTGAMALRVNGAWRCQ